MLPASEFSPSQETKKAPIYSELILGHPFSGVDRDQIIAAYIAKRFGLVDESAPIKTTPHIDEATLADNSSLVIEGFSSSTRPDFNQKNSGNFTNSPKDDLPAASCLFNTLRDDIPAKTDQEKKIKAAVGEIIQWLNAVERKKDLKNPLSLLAKDNLDALTVIFHSLKHKQLASENPNQQAFFDQCFQAIDSVISLGNSTSRIADKYTQDIEAYRSYKQKRLSEMQVEARDEERFQYRVSKTGIRLAIFSMTGIEDPVDFGANAVVNGRIKELTKNKDNPNGEKPDITILFNAETNEKGERIGTKVYIQISNDLAETSPLFGINAGELFTKRLDWLESQFGRGFIFTQESGYGGHKDVVASAPFTGSHLTENAVRFALESFFDKDRFTDDGFRQKAQEMASLIGVEKFYPAIWISPDNQWKLPEPAVEFTVTDENGGEVKVQISESDLEIYSQVLQKLPEGQRQNWLLGKTAFVEPIEIVRLREKEAIDSLRTHLEQKNVQQILSDLNEINSDTIRNLDITLKSRILELFAMDPEAISKVYDARDRQYRISTKYLPDFLLDPRHITEYQGARFTYDSLPKKFDNTLITSLQEATLSTGNQESQKAYLGSISRIIFSETYRASHQDYFFDGLVVSALRFATDGRINQEMSVQFLSDISNNYGVEMASHWKSLAKTNPGLLVKASSISPDFTNIISLLGIELSGTAAIDYIEGVPNSSVTRPDQGKIIEKFGAIKESEGQLPAANILLELGREFQTAILDKGFKSWESATPTALEGVDGKVSVAGSINVETNRETDQIQLIAEKVVGMMVETLQNTREFQDSKVRLVLASGPIQAPLDIMSKLNLEYMKKNLTTSDLLRIYVIRFNMTTNEYEELPLYRGSDRKALLELIQA